MPGTLLLAAGADVVVPHRIRLRDRVAARWHAVALDQALAEGAAPEASAALALRAQALLRPGLRRVLGAQVRRVVREAQRRDTASPAAVPICRPAVLDAAESLELLAARLVAPHPVAVSGVARARLLLTDGCGPLYWRSRREALASAARRALDGLDPRDTL